MYEHGNLEGICGYISKEFLETGNDLNDKNVSNHGVIARISEGVSA